MSAAVDNLVGLTAAQALGVLLSSLQDVKEVRLAECRPLPPLQLRLNFTDAERLVFERALSFAPTLVSRSGTPLCSHFQRCPGR
jgi:hypothetical protein